MTTTEKCNVCEGGGWLWSHHPAQHPIWLACGTRVRCPHCPDPEPLAEAFPASTFGIGERAHDLLGMRPHAWPAHGVQLVAVAGEIDPSRPAGLGASVRSFEGVGTQIDTDR